jgi:hypothetical protein
MAIWYSLWSFVIFFPIWYVWTKKNLATLFVTQFFFKAGTPVQLTPVEGATAPRVFH